MTEYKFTANYKPVEEQPIVILFDELHEELYNKGWTTHWEFNTNPLLKYNYCITLEDCATVNPEYAYDVDENGAWNYRLDNLEDAYQMFVIGTDEVTDAPIGSPALVSFNADLPKVTMGYSTFTGCSKLTTFNGDLSNLSECQLMFANCPNLKSFTSDLSSLTIPMVMFGSNYEATKKIIYDAFLGDQISFGEQPLMIEYYTLMFQHMFGSQTSLDIASVQNIANTINDITGITPPDNLDPELAAFWGWLSIGIDPQLKGNSDIDAALTTIRNKGWNVTPMYGNDNDDDNDDTQITPSEGEGTLKYNNCRTYAQCKTINADAATDVEVDTGAWNYSLDNLETGGVFDMMSDKIDGLFMINMSTPNESLKSFNVGLPKLTNGTCMFIGCTGITSFRSDLPALTNGYMMFKDTTLKSFNADLPNLTNGTCMFSGCTGLTSWNIDLPNLTNGGAMFSGCTGLTQWDTTLTNLTDEYSMFQSLTDGYSMFQDCTSLTKFSGALPNLTNGRCMFCDCTRLAEFSVDLPNLTNGRGMFYRCYGLTSWYNDLPNLTNGEYMFYGCNLDSCDIDIDLHNLTNGDSMFSGCYLTKWNTPLPELTNGETMFRSCSKLATWDTPLPKLTNGTYMFAGCKKLTEWTVDLPSLTNGNRMFYLSALASFSGDLPNLTNGEDMFQFTPLTLFSGDLSNLIRGEAMFYDTELTEWTVNLPSLIDGNSMFFYCRNLTSFEGDLSSLTNGYLMFDQCTKLTSFSGDLSSLTNGQYMFGRQTALSTKLDLASVQNIANTINNLAAVGKTGTIHIGMPSTLKSDDETAPINVALAAIRAKGWTVNELYRA